MKRFLLIVLALVMVLVLCACDKDQTNNNATIQTEGSSSTNTTGNQEDNRAPADPAVLAQLYGTTWNGTGDWNTPKSVTFNSDGTSVVDGETMRWEAWADGPSTLRMHLMRGGSAVYVVLYYKHEDNGNIWYELRIGDATAGDMAPAPAYGKVDNTQSTECTHAYNEAVTKEPTCTEEGTKTFTCGKCGDIYTEAIAKTAHTYADATCTAPKTCSVCGATEGEALQHNWKAATCIAPKTCSVCKATEGTAKGHSYSDGKCTACGETDPSFKALDTGCWRLEKYVGDDWVTHTFYLHAKGADNSPSWQYYFSSPASAETVAEAIRNGVDVEKYRHANGNYYLLGGGDSAPAACVVSGDTITVSVYDCIVTLKRIAGDQLTVTAITGDLYVGEYAIIVGDVFAWRECSHVYDEGVCRYCGEKQENYKPVNTGRWQLRTLNKKGELCSFNLYLQNDRQQLTCSYGAELSTLDPEFQKDLLENPGSLVEYEGKKYYVGMGDGWDLTYTADYTVEVKLMDLATGTQSGSTIVLERVAGDQLKVISVTGEILETGAMKVGMIFTWAE